MFSKLTICVISYLSNSDAKTKEKYKNIYEKIINTSKDGLISEMLDIKFIFDGITNYSSEEIKKQISTSDLLILDFSNVSFFYLFEIGIASTLNIPIIVIANENFNFDISNHVNKCTILYCENYQELETNTNIVTKIQKNLTEILHNYSFKSLLFYKLWFPKDTQNISIVVSPEPEKPQDANLLSHNYGFMDNVGDKDAILEIIKFLSKHYPNTNISICSSDKFNPSDIKNNIVVIGGPGGSEYQTLDGLKIDDSGNEICKKISGKFVSKISYTSDCEEMIINDERYTAEYDSYGVMNEDYGYFAAMQNPFNPKARVILIHGIHTLGVVGSARAFSDEISAETNYQILFENLIGTENISFESFFNVDVFNGEAFCPTINAKDIFMLNNKQFITSNQIPKNETHTGNRTKISKSIERLQYQIETLWKEIIKELPDYIDEAPNDYEMFSIAEGELSNLLEELKSVVTIDREQEIVKRFDEIQFQWRRRKR